jgi:hypothetical protein
MMEQSTAWCASPSLRRQMLYTQQSLMIVVLGRIHTLMMASNVLAEQSATGARWVSPIPALHQQRPMLSHATYRNYTFARWSSYHLFPHFCHPPPPQPTTKSCKEQLKMKFDIALQQNWNRQWQSGGQHWVLQDIGGSENDALLGTRAQKVKDSQPKR